MSLWLFAYVMWKLGLSSFSALVGRSWLRGQTLVTRHLQPPSHRSCAFFWHSVTNLCTQPFLCQCFGRVFLGVMLNYSTASAPLVTPNWIVAQETKPTMNLLLALWTDHTTPLRSALGSTKCECAGNLVGKVEMFVILTISPKTGSTKDLSPTRHTNLPVSTTTFLPSSKSFPPWCQTTRVCCRFVEAFQANWRWFEPGRGFLVPKLWNKTIWKAPRLPFWSCRLCPRLCAPSNGSLCTFATSFARTCPALSR